MQARQSQRCKFKEIVKNLNFKICHKTQHVTHFLKLVDKMCKYEMDLTNIVEDTEWILSTDGQTDGRTDRQAR